MDLNKELEERKQFRQLAKREGPYHTGYNDGIIETLERLQKYLVAEPENKIQTIQDEVIGAVIAERKRQDVKWGESNHYPQYWTGIIGEECGKLCQAVNETVFDNGAEARTKGGYENMRKEAIHVAAVAVAFVECLERKRLEWRYKAKCGSIF